VAESPSGGVRLDVALKNFDDDCDLAHFGPEVHIVLSRSACMRMAAIIGQAGQSAPGSLGPGSPGATAFTRELNDLLARDGNALFWDCAVDDAVGVPVGPPSRFAELADAGGGIFGPALAVGLLLLLVRGAFALWRDIAGF
jgi:hypothetical protein